MVAGKFDGPRFKETYFTDEQTAKLLDGFVSPMASYGPASNVEPETEVRTDLDMTTALRASISDPFLMEPKQIGNDRYLGGITDLYAIELAKSLADSVMMLLLPRTRSHCVRTCDQKRFWLRCVSTHA